MATQSSSEPTDDQTTESATASAESPVDTPSAAADATNVESSSTATAPETAPASSASDSSVTAPVVPVESTATEPAAPAQPTVVFVQAQQPPKNRGARGVGAVVALLGAVLFAAAYALLVLVIALVGSTGGLAPALQYLSSVTFFVPVIVFFLAYLLLVVVVNRAGWWAHVLGGFIVAIIVWVGFVGAAIIAAGVFGGAASDVNAVVLQQLTNPLGFAAAIAAREVPIWIGGMVSRRGRTAAARNVEARTAYDQELAEHRAT
ncbi:MAG: hypothetical protein Q7J04_01175, partial [Microcella sp.]|nr:hypothetical protein [Microcella sp.]